MSAISIFINVEDVAPNVRYSSVRLETNKNGEPDTFEFTVRYETSSGTIPTISDRITLEIDSVDVFKGKVLQVESRIESKEIRAYTVIAAGPLRESSIGYPIAEIYKSQTVNAIISDILSNYDHLTGIFTDTNVNCTETIDYFFIDHKKFPDVLRELSERVGYDFYIDIDKDIHFFKPGSEAASFQVSTTNGKWLRETLLIKENGDQIVNLAIVEGEKFTSNNQATEPFSGDAIETDFALGNRYNGVTVEVSSVAKTVGTWGHDDPADFDVLHNETGREIIFTTAPASGTNNISVTGFYNVPILVQYTESSSIGLHGVLPKKIVNPTIKTLDSAKQFALSELARFSTEAFSGGFSTYEIDIRAGEKIIVDNTVLGVSKTFIVQKTISRLESPNKFITEVRIASADQIETVGILARLINNQTRNVSSEEILTLIRVVNETVGVGDSVTVTEGGISSVSYEFEDGVNFEFEDGVDYEFEGDDIFLFEDGDQFLFEDGVVYQFED